MYNYNNSKLHVYILLL